MHEIATTHAADAARSQHKKVSKLNFSVWQSDSLRQLRWAWHAWLGACIISWIGMSRRQKCHHLFIPSVSPLANFACFLSLVVLQWSIDTTAYVRKLEFRMWWHIHWIWKIVFSIWFLLAFVCFEVAIWAERFFSWNYLLWKARFESFHFELFWHIPYSFTISDSN